jgi:hypothetical protein
MTPFTIRSIFFLIISFVFSFKLFAEDNQVSKKNVFLMTSPIKNKITIKLSNSVNSGRFYSAYSNPSKSEENRFFRLQMANFRAEVNYGLLSCLEIGSYFGYSRKGYIHSYVIEDSITTTFTSSKYASIINYGGQINFHPLGLFLNKDRSKVDLWIGYKYGQAIERISGSTYLSFIENGCSLGIGYYPLRKRTIGFHFEYSVGSWQLKEIPSGKNKYANDFRWGISYKF